MATTPPSKSSTHTDAAHNHGLANPTSPVQIPIKPNNNHRDKARPAKHPSFRPLRQGKHPSSSPRWRGDPLPDAIPIPPLVAAILAVTTIPPSRTQRNLRQRLPRGQEARMTVTSILEQSQGSEKKLSLSLNSIKGPLDLLLSPPEALDDDDDDDDDDYDDLFSVGESIVASPLSTRTISCESMPSLSNSLYTETVSSVESPHSPTRARKMQPTRRSLTPVSSPPGERADHPLYHDQEHEHLDLTVFDPSPSPEEKKGGMRLAFRPLRSVFKSNLTSSLRALRNAARSFSNMNMPSIPPEDFLSRSILTMEPNVPFTDERMPPILDEEPSAAMRRYLNPTQTARLESRASTCLQSRRSPFTASIQMQTYKVHRTRIASRGTRGPTPTSLSSNLDHQPGRDRSDVDSLPFGPRQREMRENPNFIRVAVMEMVMRRSGKLDEQRPGRARWALPPRKPSTKPYKVGADGVPARWVPVTF